MTLKKKFRKAEAEQQVQLAPEIEHKEQVIDLRQTLEKFKDKEGIIGYILRTPTSASVDLKDPRKIIDYAALSTTAIEFGENLSDTYGLGEISSTVLEGKDIKILSLNISEQMLSVFMEKNVDHNTVCRDLTRSIQLS